MDNGVVYPFSNFPKEEMEKSMKTKLILASGSPRRREILRDAGIDFEIMSVDTDESCATKTPGIFVAGDCRSKRIRQVVTASADGAIAAMAACRYLD